MPERLFVVIALAIDRYESLKRLLRSLATSLPLPKSFLGKSAIYDFHLAVGQFINYRLALTEQEPSRVLYLAIPVETYQSFFSRQFIQAAIEHNNIKLLVYDSNKEVIVKWKN